MDQIIPDPAAATERILVRGVNWLGDAVMSIPALLRLREAKPRARIALLAPAKLAGLWDGQGCIDELLLFSPEDNLWQTARLLRAKNFTIGVAFPNSLRSTLELWLAGIPRRVGYARPGRTFLLTEAVPARTGAVLMRKRSEREIRELISRGSAPPPIPGTAHHIHDYLRLVAALGASPEPLAPRLIVGEGEAAKTASHLGMESAPNASPWFGLNPGAEYGPAKRWPAERFAATAVALQKQTHCRWVIFGGEKDHALAAGIAAEIAVAAPSTPPPLNLAGRTRLRELMAALKSCRLLLTNDSGPMHLAAALGTPVVVLFGSTSPEMTGPSFYPTAEIVRVPGVPCAPCFRRSCPIDFRCMNGIEPAAVIKAALRATHPWQDDTKGRPHKEKRHRP